MARGDNAAIRAWAADNGYELNPRGPLPKEVKRRFYEENSFTSEDEYRESQQPEPEPEPEPEFWDTAEEAHNVYAQDPEPKRQREQKTRKAPGRVTSAQKKDIRAKLSLLLALPAGLTARRDPYCGGALLRQIPEISEALVDIVCDSADLVVFFTQGGGYMKWLTLATALQPVAEVAWQHHVSHKIGDVTDERLDGGYVPAGNTRYHAPSF